MTGFLYITEHRNYGDVQWETPVEPNQRVTCVKIGEIFDKVAADTRMVLLFATVPCLVAFVEDGATIEDAESHAFPVAAETETPRLMHPNTFFRIVSRERKEAEAEHVKMQATQVEMQADLQEAAKARGASR